MKKMMILGAGVYQMPLIEAAKKCGLFTIVVSIPGDYPGFAIADKIYYVNTTDKEAVLTLAKEEKIDGICTTGTDVAVETIGFVCEKMGLAGVSEAAAVRATDKAAMKEAFVRGGVSTASYRKVRTLAEAEEAVQELGLPVVVKRVDSSGSRGITVVKEMEDGDSGVRGAEGSETLSRKLAQALADALKGSRKDYALVEKFVDGVEIGVDGVIQGGKLVFLAPHEKLVYRGAKITVPAGHGFPYKGSAEVQAEIRRQMELAVHALGLDNCSVNADVFVKDYGEVSEEKSGETMPGAADGMVSIIEMGGRTGATCIPELISMYYGIDFYEKILDNALGIPLDFTPVLDGVPCMAKLLMSPVDGVITGIDEEGLAAVRSDGTVAALDFPVGHKVEAMENGTNRIGHVVAAVSDEKELTEIVNRVSRCIYVNQASLESLWQQEVL